ncbi:MAG: serine acetyltransferase [Verrucomicrobia bacterium]|nr:serine acetyltransferase [Verrucomicrobiota bacterium]MBV9672511.1 serine acetyltransferase [Verrucomicrobiota bacterium]
MQKSLAPLVQEILGSYTEIGGINNIDGLNLPSKRAIAQICEDLLQLLFPGFHDEEPIATKHVPQITSARIFGVAERLYVETFKSLRVQEPKCPSRRAEEILVNLLQEFPGVRKLLKTDVQAAYEGDPASTSYEEIIVSYPSIEAIAIQRLAHILYREKLPLIPRIMTEWAHSRTGIDIHPGAEIGSYFFIDHGTGVVIGETCKIGSHVKLYHGVTLGARSFQKDNKGKIRKGGKRHPNVEDWVTIYPNATILGGETVIGARSTIGGNVFLMQSIPPDTLVTNEKAQIKITSKKKPLPDFAPTEATA